MPPMLGAGPGGPELLVLLLAIILPIAFIYIAYRLLQGFRAFQEGRQEGT